MTELLMQMPMIDKQREEDIKIACAYTMAWYLISSYTDKEYMEIRVCKSMCWNSGLDFEIYAIKDGNQVYFKELPRDEFTKRIKTHFNSKTKHTQLVGMFINCDDVEIEWDNDIEAKYGKFGRIYGEEFREMSYGIDYYDLNGEVLEF